MSAHDVEVCVRVDSSPANDTASRRPIRNLILKEFNSLASFLGNQALWRKRQDDVYHDVNDIQVIAFSDVEEELEGLRLRKKPSVTDLKRTQNYALPVLASPRSLLTSMVPNNASQLVQMNLILLDEHPERDVLRRAAWKGCSARNRAQVWRMLLGYEPLKSEDRETILEAKRKEYQEYVNVLYAPSGGQDVLLCGQIGQNRCEYRRYLAQWASINDRDGNNWNVEMDEAEYYNFSARTLRQIEVDLPRTHPETAIFHVETVRNAMRRILYTFGMLHPNKNYVQGMNELLTPLLVVFLSEHLTETQEKGVESFLRRTELDGAVTGAEVARAEADAFWTFSRVVASVEDNFIAEQPGIVKRVARLEEIVALVDAQLAAHLADNGNEFVQFALRWMNCLLMRELPFGLVVRLWDALFAEEDGLADLHVYFCAAMMVRFRAQLLRMGFEECIMLLQHLPTREWSVGDVDVLLSQAYVWKQRFKLCTLAVESVASPSLRSLSKEGSDVV